MKKILFLALFAWLMVSAGAQAPTPKTNYAPDGKYVAVVAAIQDGESPAVDAAEVLIVSGEVKLKGKVKRYESDAPFCFFEYDNVKFKDSVYIKVCHPDYQIYEKKVAAKDFLDKEFVLLKRKSTK